MFSILPKSKLAAEKASKLSELEVAIIDMYIEAAFLRPDSHLTFLDTATTVVNGRNFDIYVVELEIMIVSLVISDRGKVGILDFFVSRSLFLPPDATATM
jgi:hypothetical protein